MYYEQKFLKRAHFNNNTTLMLGKPRAHSERTFAHKSAHLRKRAHVSKVPTSTFVCHNSARAENCKTYTFHDHEHKFKRAEKSVLWKIQVYIHIFVQAYWVRLLSTNLLASQCLNQNYSILCYSLLMFVSCIYYFAVCLLHENKQDLSTGLGTSQKQINTHE